MRRLINTMALAFLLLWTSAASAQGYAAKVSSVPDGDTLILDTGVIVRLAGIDAPELASGDRPAQAYAEQAREALRELLGGGLVRIEPTGPGRDRHGRILAHVLAPDGKSLNKAMVEWGLAFVYTHEHDPRTGGLLQAQSEAMKLGRGFWPLVLSLDGARGSWVGNRRSMRFHDTECPDGLSIAKTNAVPLPSLAEAFRQGYSPCAAARHGRRRVEHLQHFVSHRNSCHNLDLHCRRLTR
jgi:micrococcal nuclease